MRTKLVRSLALAFSIGIAQAASAADMPVKAPIVSAPIAAPGIWTGVYVGVTAGYVWGNSQHCDPPGSPFCTASFSVDGLEGGGTLGYNWQIDNWVLGLETDFSGAAAKGNTTSRRPPDPFGCGIGTCDTHLNWFGTGRGRVGYAYDRLLPYITGGFAYGELYAALGILPATSSTASRAGWTFGGGLEYAITPEHWSLKVEYLYMHLNDVFYDTAQVCVNRSCTAVHNNFNVGRLGVNYRF